jgi:hypothetical protein
MAEQATEYTPYRFAFNNPLLYIDPNGMFESRSEARRYAEENGIETGWLYTCQKLALLEIVNY